MTTFAKTRPGLGLALGAALAMGLGLAQAGPALAQDTGTDWRWSGLVGAGAVSAPSYTGSANTETQTVPVLRLSYGPFGLDREGLSWTVLERQDRTLALTLGYGGGREASDLPFSGFDDIQDAASYGVKASFGAGPVQVLAALSTTTGGAEGTEAMLGLSHSRQVGDRLMVSGRLTAHYADADYMQGYFGVTPAQAAANATTAYSPGAGFEKVQLSLTANYALTRRAVLGGSLSVAHHGDTVRQSPIFEDEALTAVIYLGYRF